MAVQKFTNPSIIIAGVNLSDHISSFELSQSFEELDSTAFGDEGRKRISGLADASVDITFQQDYAAASVEATIGSRVDQVVPCAVKADAAARGPLNPEWTFSVLITEWTPLAGAVGDLLEASVSWPVSGEITRTITAPPASE